MWHQKPSLSGSSAHLNGLNASVQPDLTQVVLDNDVGDGIKHKLHVLGVRGTSEVGVDLLNGLPFIQVLKLTVDVFCRLLVCLPTWSREEQKQASVNMDFVLRLRIRLI